MPFSLTMRADRRQLYERALEIRKSKLGPTHAKTLSTAQNLALVIKSLDMREESEGDDDGDDDDDDDNDE